MLRLSLQIFKGISAAREKKLWLAGILDWNSLKKIEIPQQSLFGEDDPKRHGAFDDAKVAYERRDLSFFADRLDRSEHYRIALTFPEECLFLDIETTGLSRYYDHITAIGWSSGTEYGFFVRGQSDRLFRKAVSSARC